MRALPHRFQMCTSRKNALSSWPQPLIPALLEQEPSGQSLWSHFQRFFIQIPGFSVCHPVYDELMHRALRHAIYSAIANNTETTTFMFLPCWRGRMSTSPYSKLLNAYSHTCCILGTISSSNLDYATLLLNQQRKLTPSPQLEYARNCCLEYSSTIAS